MQLKSKAIYGDNEWYEIPDYSDRRLIGILNTVLILKSQIRGIELDRIREAEAAMAKEKKILVLDTETGNPQALIDIIGLLDDGGRLTLNEICRDMELIYNNVNSVEAIATALDELEGRGLVENLEGVYFLTAGQEAHYE